MIRPRFPGDVEREERAKWDPKVTAYNEKHFHNVDEYTFAMLIGNLINVGDLSVEIEPNDYTFERLTDPGMHYSSCLAKVCIRLHISKFTMAEYLKRHYEGETDEILEMSIVLKTVPNGKKQEAGSTFVNKGERRPKGRDLYILNQREREFYRKMWPAIARSLEAGDYTSSDYIVPVYYFLPEMEKTSILFLSDITEDSFELRDRSSDLDLEHMKVAMKYLARLHAPTYVYNMHGLRDNRISDLPSIGKCQMHPDNMYFHIFTAGLRLLAIEMKTWMGLERFAGTVLNMAGRAYHDMINFRKAGNLKVLVHGDFWHSNIFFKYEEYDDCGSRIRVPERSRFIDFQWCQWGSPAIDILTLLYVSAETEVFANHRNDLIDIYYTEMRQLINKIATKENIIIFSMEKEELYNDIKKMEIYGLYLGLTYRWIRRASPHRPAFFDTLTNYKCFEEKSFWRTLIRTHRRELEPAFKLFLSRVFDV